MSYILTNSNFTFIGKEPRQTRKINTDSFVETLKSLVEPYKNVDVHFIYVNDEIEGTYVCLNIVF